MESGHIPQFREHFLDQLVKTFESAKHWQPPVKSLKGNQDGTSNTAEVTSSDAKSVSSPEQEKEEKDQNAVKETNTPTAGLESPPEAPISPREDNAQPIERLEKVVSPQNVTPTTTAAVTGSHTAGPILTQTSAAAPVTSVELTRAMQSPVNLEEQPKIPVVAAASDPASGVVAPQPVYPTTNIQAATTKTAQPTVARQLSGGQATDVPVQTDNAPVSNTTDVPDIQPSLEGNTQPVVVTSATGQPTTYVKHATQQNVVLPTQDPSHPSSVSISQPITAKQQLLAGQQAAANQQQGLQSQQALADLDQKLSKLHNKKQPQQQKSAFSQPPVQNPAAPVQQFLQQTQPPLPGGMMGANVQQPMAGQAGQPVYGLPVAKQQMQLYYLQQQTGILWEHFFQLPPGVDPMAFYGQQQMYPQHHQQQQQVKASTKVHAASTATRYATGCWYDATIRYAATTTTTRCASTGIWYATTGFWYATTNGHASTAESTPTSGIAPTSCRPFAAKCCSPSKAERPADTKSRC
ncbi:hypothetical protein BSL78_23584 [Apostichopus japonicus]|uniref:Uncharacterized protein n=1 Tax=Stichopus japonicus TaxID=307972 RepID=A0A2G8JUY3_STIJA|nr:hypothetical protein BSL78_23584 [Apostichopus japonicus]